MLAGVGRGLRWLTSGGAAAAALVGAFTFWGGGLRAAALLGLFFVSGSLLTRRGTSQHDLNSSAGGHTPLRTARQVLANGAWAGVGAIAVVYESALGWALVVGSLATAQADTWATEIGARSRRLPRLITTGEAVPRGTSGAVSLLGTAAGVLGALTLASVAAALGLRVRPAAGGAVAGVLGLFTDSLLGATLQATYVCRRCGTRCERPVHCGAAAEHVAGLKWLDNDAVNLAATSAGALVAVALAGWPA